MNATPNGAVFARDYTLTPPAVTSANLEYERLVDTGFGPNNELLVMVNCKDTSIESDDAMFLGHLSALEWWIRDDWGLT